jgi:hypothetical protein
MNPGDRVKAFGNKGTIKKISENGMFLIVRFDDTNDDMIFYRDGRLFKWNKKPILRKIETRHILRVGQKVMNNFSKRIGIIQKIERHKYKPVQIMYEGDVVVSYADKTDLEKVK